MIYIMLIMTYFHLHFFIGHHTVLASSESRLHSLVSTNCPCGQIVCRECSNCASIRNDATIEDKINSIRLLNMIAVSIFKVAHTLYSYLFQFQNIIDDWLQKLINSVCTDDTVLSYRKKVDAPQSRSQYRIQIPQGIIQESWEQWHCIHYLHRCHLACVELPSLCFFALLPRGLQTSSSS